MARLWRRKERHEATLDAARRLRDMHREYNSWRCTTCGYCQQWPCATRILAETVVRLIETDSVQEACPDAE